MINKLKYCLLVMLIFTHVISAEPVHLSIVTEQLPPFQMRIPDGVGGYVTEIIKASLAETNFSYDINIYPWARAFNLALHKKNTCVYSIARTPEREKLFQWTKPIASTNASFVGLKSNHNIHINTLEDVKNYVTAVIRDDISHQLLLQNGFIEGEHFYLVNNPDSLLKLLVTRKDIDLIMIDYLTIKYRSAYSKLDSALFTPYMHVNQIPLVFYLACSKNTSSQVVSQLSQALDTIKANGIYQKIIDKWLNKEDRLKETSKHIEAMKNLKSDQQLSN